MIYDAGVGAGARAARRWPRWNLTFYITTGQSLDVGGAAPVTSTTQPYNNVCIVDDRGIFAGYILTDLSGAHLSFQPLISPPQAYDSIDGATTYYPKNVGGPANVAGECPGVRMANQRTADARALTGLDYKTGIGVVGAAGQPLAAIQKATNGNSNSYAAAIWQAKMAKLLSGANTMGFGPVVMTHGESDADAATPLATYLAGLVQFQKDYETDLRKISGQSRGIPLVLSQMGSNPPSGQGENVIANAMYQAAFQNRGKIVLAGPKYGSTFADGQHISDPHVYAEKNAQVLSILDNDGIWEPCWPVGFARNGTSVTVYAHVPVGPLIIDQAHTAPHLSGGLSAWGPGLGLEAYDAVEVVSAGTGNGVSPIVLTVPDGSKYSNGQTVYCNGHAGNTNANGPHTITVSGNNITLVGTTGNGTWGTNPNFGQPTIANVISVGTPSIVMIGPNMAAITFTIGRTPTTGLNIAYAHTPDAAYGTLTGGFSGPAWPNGRCGNILDSDPYRGLSGIVNPNRMIEFAQVVP